MEKSDYLIIGFLVGGVVGIFLLNWLMYAQCESGKAMLFGNTKYFCQKVATKE